jgi:hypothetical protein
VRQFSGLATQQPSTFVQQNLNTTLWTYTWRTQNDPWRLDQKIIYWIHSAWRESHWHQN